MSSGGFHPVGEIARLTRLHSAGLTALPFVVGSALAGAPPLRVLAAFGAGVLLHCFGCALNDIADREYDALNPHRSSSPLVSGSMSLQAAARVAVISATLAPVSLLLGKPTVQALLGMLAVVGIQAWLNWSSKRCRYPVLMDLLFGGASAAPLLVTSGLGDREFGLAGLLLASGYAIGVAALNIVAGNLKDLQEDLLAGSRTTAISLGVRPAHAGVTFTWSYAALVVSLEALSFGFLALSALSVPGSAAVLAGAGVASCAAVGIWDIARLLRGVRRAALRGREPFIAVFVLAFIFAAAAIGGWRVALYAMASVLVWGASTRPLLALRPRLR